MTAKLVASYYVPNAIAWYEDDEEGAVVGQEGTDLAAIEVKYAKATSLDEKSYFAVEIAVSEFAASEPNAGFDRTRGAWVFDTSTAFKKAMAVAKAANKLEHEAAANPTAWPEWAKLALANGWKAPKGWKP